MWSAKVAGLVMPKVFSGYNFYQQIFPEVGFVKNPFQFAIRALASIHIEQENCHQNAFSNPSKAL